MARVLAEIVTRLGRLAGLMALGLGCAWAVGPALAQDTARQRLLERAGKELARPIVTVRDKTSVAPSGDPHDYFALAPYHWPNPRTADGLPYLFRDGQVNPEANTDRYDRGTYFRWGDAVTWLAVGYALGSDEALAQRAADWLRAWWIDPATRMNPNLEYAQCIPGQARGLPIGLIRGMTLIDMARCERLLLNWSGWTSDDHRQCQAWIAEYARWLAESELGQAEARAKNNHGTWYDAQRACLALYLGDSNTARQVAGAAQQRRVAAQIQPDGRQPLETQRTKSWDYSVMNLEGLAVLADAGLEAECDLWRFQTDDGRSLRAALDYLRPFALRQSVWSEQQIKDFRPQSLAPVLDRAARIWPEASYDHDANELAEGDPEVLLRRCLMSVPWLGKATVDPALAR